MPCHWGNTTVAPKPNAAQQTTITDATRQVIRAAPLMRDAQFATRDKWGGPVPMQCDVMRRNSRDGRARLCVTVPVLSPQSQGLSAMLTDIQRWFRWL